MEEQFIGTIAIYLSWILIASTILFFLYGSITGHWLFISSGGTIEDCIPNYMGSCDM